MPLNPSPKIAATANSPASFWVSRNPIIATIWHTEPASTVRNPPMRSATQPQNCRLTKAQPSSTDSIAAPCDGGMPRSLQNATRWPCGIAIGTQHSRPAKHRGRAQLRPQSRAPSRRAGPAARRVAGAASGAGPEHDRGGRHDQRDLERGKISIVSRQPNAAMPLREDRRPDRAGDDWPLRDQRQRRAAAPVEPARDIDVERRVDAGIAEQADKHAVPDIERCRRRCVASIASPSRDHHRAEHDDPAHAEALGDPPIGMPPTAAPSQASE